MVDARPGSTFVVGAARNDLCRPLVADDAAIEVVDGPLHVALGSFGLHSRHNLGDSWSATSFLPLTDLPRGDKAESPYHWRDKDCEDVEPEPAHRAGRLSIASELEPTAWPEW